jgi:hypothetical protein
MAPKAKSLELELRGLPKPDFGQAGPIVIKGYPGELPAGMSEPALHVGFTPEGTFGYCKFQMCCANDNSQCWFSNEQGATVRHTATQTMFVLEGSGPVEIMPTGAMQKMAKEMSLLETKVSDMIGHPPKLEGTWSFAQDIELQVLNVSVPAKETGELSVAPIVRVGGKVGGEPVVYPFTSPVPPHCAETAAKNHGSCYEAHLNTMARSADGSEFGLLFYFTMSSHGSMHSTLRLKSNALAAAIYNDTGYVNHRKKAYARAEKLFAKATYADPSKSLFAYNLACALARQSDARAEAALNHAIAIDGEKIRTRAKKDADFEAVRQAPWFVGLTASP